MINPYNADYFERGIETGTSCYSNYRWLPELTVPMAMSYIDYLGLTKEHKILDFGCAKGFTVKALRLLYRQAWGCDVSPYAVNSADNETRQYLKISDGDIPWDFDFDFIISKDVFEHIPEDFIDGTLQILAKAGNKMFAIVPLATTKGEFVIPAYNLDTTHCLARTYYWWVGTFKENGWDLIDFSYHVPGIKDSWSNFEDGNGFFLLETNNNVDKDRMGVVV